MPKNYSRAAFVRCLQGLILLDGEIELSIDFKVFIHIVEYFFCRVCREKMSYSVNKIHNYVLARRGIVFVIASDKWGVSGCSTVPTRRSEYVLLQTIFDRTPPRPESLGFSW
jgi:hypothetical protein